MDRAEESRFTLTYRIVNHDRTSPTRSVEVLASREEIERLKTEGYLVRERLFGPRPLEALRQALEEVSSAEMAVGREVSTSRRFGGLFLRHLMEKHETFLELFRFEPLLSVARAVLGPQLQVRPMTARITYPDQPNQETHWHMHQRIVPDPLPAFFCYPHVIDCLIYLDDVNRTTGALQVVPSSHLWLHRRLDPDTHTDLPGQVELELPAGSAVIIHGNLWHRALPGGPDRGVRRMLILPYAAAWLQLPTFGDRPANGLMRRLYENADAETLELLGEPEGLY